MWWCGSGSDSRSSGEGGDVNVTRCGGDCRRKNVPIRRRCGSRSFCCSSSFILSWRYVSSFRSSSSSFGTMSWLGRIIPCRAKEQQQRRQQQRQQRRRQRRRQRQPAKNNQDDDDEDIHAKDLVWRASPQRWCQSISQSVGQSVSHTVVVCLVHHNEDADDRLRLLA